MWKTMDEATLKSKTVADLKQIAKTFGLEGYTKMKKAELIAALMMDEEPAQEKDVKTPEQPVTQKSDAEGENKDEKASQKSRSRNRSQSRRKKSAPDTQEDAKESAADHAKSARGDKADRADKAEKAQHVPLLPWLRTGDTLPSSRRSNTSGSGSCIFLGVVRETV